MSASRWRASRTWWLLVDDGLSLVELVIDLNDRFALGGVDRGFGGALALAYYVEDPRTTRDIDLNVSAPVETAEEVFRLLPASVAWDAKDVARCIRDGQIRLWSKWHQTGIPVDLFFPQHEFHAAVAAGVTERPFARADYRIPVIAAAHLAVFKALFDRPKDWVDIASMLAARTVDVAEAAYWLGLLLGEDHATVHRFVGLAGKAAAGLLARPGAEMDTPALDWRSLGHSPA